MTENICYFKNNQDSPHSIGLLDHCLRFIARFVELKVRGRVRFAAYCAVFVKASGSCLHWSRNGLTLSHFPMLSLCSDRRESTAKWESQRSSNKRALTNSLSLCSSLRGFSYRVSVCTHQPISSSFFSSLFCLFAQLTFEIEFPIYQFLAKLLSFTRALHPAWVVEGSMVRRQVFRKQITNTVENISLRLGSYTVILVKYGCTINALRISPRYCNFRGSVTFQLFFIPLKK